MHDFLLQCFGGVYPSINKASLHLAVDFSCIVVITVQQFSPSREFPFAIIVNSQVRKFGIDCLVIFLSRDFFFLVLLEALGIFFPIFALIIPFTWNPEYSPAPPPPPGRLIHELRALSKKCSDFLSISWNQAVSKVIFRISV